MTELIVIQQLAAALLAEWSACPSAGSHGISLKCGSEDCTFTCDLFDIAFRIAQDATKKSETAS